MQVLRHKIKLCCYNSNDISNNVAFMFFFILISGHDFKFVLVLIIALGGIFMKSI